MTIKKAYVGIVEFLELNSNKKVSTILEELKTMCEATNSGGSEIGKTFLKDAEGTTIAIYCYYFKQWFPLSHVEVGVKNGTASGFNTMCKEGVSLWTKQQRIAKQSGEQLLNDIGSGLVTIDQMPTIRAKIEEDRQVVVAPTQAEYFFNTAEEVLAFINQE